MEENRYLSTAEVARSLGVGVTTVKRWVDEGILPAHRTPGGHRKLLLADVLRLAREGRFPQVDLGLLDGSAHDPPEPERLRRDLVAALLRGDDARVRLLLRRAYFGGLPPEQLADDVVGPAMTRVGHDWEHHRIDAWHEHRGTMLCAAALHELRGRLTERPVADRPLAVGGGPEDDPYLLANLLIELVLLDLGWDVINLGPNTPLPSVTRVLRAVRPRLFWLSVSYLQDAAGFTAAYRETFAEAERLKVAVAVGGRGLTPELRAAIPYTTYGDGLAHLASFARNLHAPPRRPPRGRPPGGKARG
jgi:excisionase family DNA binding protein